MKKWFSLTLLVFNIMLAGFIVSCSDDSGEGPSETDFTDLLTNQVDNIVIPAMVDYQTQVSALANAISDFVDDNSSENLDQVFSTYADSYVAYQRAAVHNYYATANQGLVESTNLYPIDIDVLNNLISTESYNFFGSAQRRANGFPAIDYMLYGMEDALTYLTEDPLRISFLNALVISMDEKADALVSAWQGNLRDNFIGNGGTALGSSISVQLNESLVYYEDNIRENKVGIPIGLLGPNDSPIDPDPTKIEAYHEAAREGNEVFTFSLLRASIEEMERLYTGGSGQGYDDLLTARDQASVDDDIRDQFAIILNTVNERNSISGDRMLYDNVQRLVTLFKSDLFPILNVQDADGANDGD